jgi:hypothetical protein
MVAVRMTALALAGLLGAGVIAAAPALADDPAPKPPQPPQPNPAISDVCNDAFCTPGITPNVVLGAPCDNTAYYVFGTAVAGPSIQPGRLVFCGSPRRYEPRYFRTMPMVGIKELGVGCSGMEDNMAQAPDGLFLTCALKDGNMVWVQGNA